VVVGVGVGGEGVKDDKRKQAYPTLRMRLNPYQIRVETEYVVWIKLNYCCDILCLWGGTLIGPEWGCSFNTDGASVGTILKQ
jgi:hypothetical protein